MFGFAESGSRLLFWFRVCHRMTWGWQRLPNPFKHRSRFASGFLLRGNFSRHVDPTSGETSVKTNFLRMAECYSRTVHVSINWRLPISYCQLPIGGVLDWKSLMNLKLEIENWQSEMGTPRPSQVQNLLVELWQLMKGKLDFARTRRLREQ